MISEYRLIHHTSYLSTGWIVFIVLFVLFVHSLYGFYVWRLARKAGKSHGWFALGFFGGMIGALVGRSWFKDKDEFVKRPSTGRMEPKTVEDKLVDLKRRYDRNSLSEKQFNIERERVLGGV